MVCINPNVWFSMMDLLYDMKIPLNFINSSNITEELIQFYEISEKDPLLRHIKLCNKFLCHSTQSIDLAEGRLKEVFENGQSGVLLFIRDKVNFYHI